MTKYKIEDAVQYRTENPAIKNAIKLVADADGTMLAAGMPLAGGELAKLVALANLGAAYALYGFAENGGNRAACEIMATARIDAAKAGIDIGTETKVSK